MKALSDKFLKLLIAAIIAAPPGCAKYTFPEGTDVLHYQMAATKIDYPDIETLEEDEAGLTPAPITVAQEAPTEYRDMTLEETLHIALENAKVIRDLGGSILRTTGQLRTIYDPAIQETDPRYGVDAALAAFDANLASSIYAEKNDRAINNIFFGGGTRSLQQNDVVMQTALTKVGATGSTYSLRNNTGYDENNSPGNAFPSVWNTNIEMQYRHPLLQGGGVDFNRIAGPSRTPGVMNGVLIARMNTDISLAEFETQVRNLVSDVENTYWDLYFAYRDLDAKVRARDSALETWRRINALFLQGRRGGEAEKEAQAREQHFRFEEEVVNALSGRLLEGTHINNGSSGGTFRGTGGVHVTERRLRLLIGLPITDGFLIRPADEPIKAKAIFNWDVAVAEAIATRPELRRQQWLVKRKEAELIASRNFLKPTLDTVGLYRWRGLGQDLFQNHDNKGQFGDAVSNLTGGDFQEWQLGVEFSMTLGQRQALAGIRNAEFQLAREKAILRNLERQVVHDLSTTLAEADRAYTVVQTTFNRRNAAREQVQAVQAAYEADNAPLDLVLEAQRRFAEAESRYYFAQVDYSLGVKNVQYEKGSLLEYNGVHLQEGPWPDKAYHDADKLDSIRGRPLRFTNLPYLPDSVFPGAPGPPGAAAGPADSHGFYQLGQPGAAAAPATAGAPAVPGEGAGIEVPEPTGQFGGQPGVEPNPIDAQPAEPLPKLE